MRRLVRFAAGGALIAVSLLQAGCEGCDSSTSPSIVTLSPCPLGLEVGGEAGVNAEVGTFDPDEYEWFTSGDVRLVSGADLVTVLTTGSQSVRVRAIGPGVGGVIGTVDVVARLGARTASASPCTVNLGRTPSATVSFGDQEFNAGDWEIVVIQQTGGATQVVERRETGGDPGAFRYMRDSVPAGSGTLLHIAHRYRPASYNPAMEGAITSIDYAESRRQLSPPFSETGSAFFLEQGACRFFMPVGPGAAFTYGTCGRGAVTDDDWVGLGFTGLTAASFTSPTPGCALNFGSGGGEIRFGYARCQSGDSGGRLFTYEHGIDDWRVTIHR